MTATTTHEIATHHSTEALEARDTAENPLEFVRHHGPEVSTGDYVVLVSGNGDSFIGHVVDADEYGRYYVELD